MWNPKPPECHQTIIWLRKFSIQFNRKRFGQINFYDPIADNQEPEVESSDATTAVLQVEEITVQESDQPAITRSHSNESCDDKTGMVDEPIDEPASPTPGETQEQPALGDTEGEPAKEVNNKSSDEEDFPGASSE